MRNPTRALAFGVFVVFGAAICGHYVQLLSPPGEVPLAPSLLPAAYANPAEVAWQDTLRRGETLSELLARAQIAETDAQALIRELAHHEDPRHLQAGSIVSYRKSFASGDMRGLALRMDADRTLDVHRESEGWKGEVKEVPVITDTVVFSGSVESSLYAALMDGEGSGVPAEERQAVADILADRIFAWQIDFSRDLRPNDTFRILYQRLVRPDGTAREGRVLGVQFSVNGRDYEAYRFTTADGTEDYYDREGESLRRAFLRAPLQFRRITSAYTKSRFHPILKKNRPHNGIDYAARTGTPVFAVGDGVIKQAGKNGGYGNVVEIRHNRGYGSRYAHLRGFAKGMRSGTRVKQGEVIGYVGSTGLATGPHLHYEFHSGGRPVDPNTVKSITGDPVPSGERAHFAEVLRGQLAAMERFEGSRFAAGVDGDPPVADR